MNLTPEQVLRHGQATGNDRLAKATTVLSVLMLGKMVWDQFGLSNRESLSHRQRVNLERLDKLLDRLEQRMPGAER